LANKAVLVILSILIILVIALGIKVMMQGNELNAIKNEVYNTIPDEFLQEDDYYNDLEILYDRLKVLYDLHGLAIK
jgi:hypothetical protein